MYGHLWEANQHLLIVPVDMSRQYYLDAQELPMCQCDQGMRGMSNMGSADTGEGGPHV